MPANLPPQYYELEKRCRAASSPDEKLALLEEMLSAMPKHKGTDKLQADVKKRIAKIKAEGKKSGSAASRSTYNIKPEGAGQVALVGPPNSGKSSLLRSLTGSRPEVADYPFTTRAPLAGMAAFEDVKIQLVDLPAVTGEFLEPWVPDLIRRADLLLIILDLTGDPLHQLREVENVLAEKRIFPAGGPGPADGRGGLVKPDLLAANKVDAPDAEAALELFLEMIEPKREVTPLSIIRADNLDRLPGLLFQALGLIRVYTKAPGKPAEVRSPFTLPRGSTALDLAEKIHKDVAQAFKYARVWGKGLVDGRMVQRDHPLSDGEIVEIHT
ncbi:MAG: GTPase [Pseudomonadota bacterium]